MKGRQILRIVSCLVCLMVIPVGASQSADAPAPLLKHGQPVEWWFMFKLNAAQFPGCAASAVRACIFGGDLQPYPKFSQQFVFASNEKPELQEGSGCAGDTDTDPLGATFSEVYNSATNYVIWNDQFYGEPIIDDCKKKPKKNCFAPWGHSKGMLAWDDQGNGFVLQVTTPSWPAAGSKLHPRHGDGNTLGCVIDNDVQVSQHFFALKLTKSDVSIVLKALENASVVTDPHNVQVVNVKAPQEFKEEVQKLGKKLPSEKFTKDTLSSGVILISKPSRLHVPPWQMVSAILGHIPLRVASWWTSPEIPSTSASTEIGCWDESLGEDKGVAVQIATTGRLMDGRKFGLTGGLGTDKNHAKIGVSMPGSGTFTILGDMNQQGDATGENCGSSQNARGGLFFVLSDPELFKSVTNLLKGESAPAQ